MATLEFAVSRCERGYATVNWNAENPREKNAEVAGSRAQHTSEPADENGDFCRHKQNDAKELTDLNETKTVDISMSKLRLLI
jgi:hypothetical protein